MDKPLQIIGEARHTFSFLHSAISYNHKITTITPKCDLTKLMTLEKSDHQE